MPASTLDRFRARFPILDRPAVRDRVAVDAVLEALDAEAILWRASVDSGRSRLEERYV